MENEKTVCTMVIRKADDVSAYLPEIDGSDMYAGFYDAVSENDGDIGVICLGEKTIGLAEAENGKDEGYVYVYIFPEYRHNGYGCAAAKLAERQITSPELRRIYTSYSVKDEAARRFAAKCGYPAAYASAHMTYHGERFALPELPVRQYEDGDYAEAFTLSAEAFHKMRLETGRFPDSVPGTPGDESRRAWAESADERYVYTADHEIVGYAHVEGPELDSVSIRISRQGNGFGKRFVQFLVNRILEKETEPPCLWCVVENGKARSLYDSLGFEEDRCEEFAIRRISPDR